MPPDAILVCAAGGLPGELHKLWQTRQVGSYHLEDGYSCMGYEIAGALGVKLARPEREVVVLVGDGSYLMLNSGIATSVMLGIKLTIVVLDNRGFGSSTACSAPPEVRRSTICWPIAAPRRRWISARTPRAWVHWQNRWTASPNSRPRCAVR